MDDYFVEDSGGFAPGEFADIKQCVETLLSIREGSQPLDRSFGINLDQVTGYPLDVAKNMLALEIIEKIRTYEPRAEVDGVEFEANINGQLVPHVHIIKAEEE